MPKQKVKKITAKQKNCKHDWVEIYEGNGKEDYDSCTKCHLTRRNRRYGS